MKDIILSLIIVISILAGISFLAWWISQPIEIIYDEEAPPYPYSLGGDDYH